MIALQADPFGPSPVGAGHVIGPHAAVPGNHHEPAIGDGEQVLDLKQQPQRAEHLMAVLAPDLGQIALSVDTPAVTSAHVGKDRGGEAATVLACGLGAPGPGYAV